MRKLIICLLCIQCCLPAAPSAVAQSARWAIAPDYQYLEPISEQIYRGRTETAAKAVDREGNLLAEADSITDFSEGYALALQRQGALYRLTGILSESKQYVPIEETWYVKEYPFFSEGKMPVLNQKGNYGFIDTNGRLVLDFVYTSVHPFSEGRAAVSKVRKMKKIFSFNKHAKEKVYYIDGLGNELALQSDIGDIYSGTTFRNGEALVIPKDGRYIFIDPSGRMLRIENSLVLRFDRKYALLNDTDPVSEPEQAPAVYDGPTTFAEGSEYGYRIGDAVILPAQFDRAMPFSGGYALASRKGKFGILELLDEDIRCEVLPGTIKSANPDLESVEYRITAPEAYRNQALTLVCTIDGTASTCTVPSGADRSRNFAFMLPKGERSLLLEADGLTLWNDSMGGDGSSQHPNEKRIDQIQITVSPSKVKANMNDLATIAIGLTNKAQSPLKFRIEISGPQLHSVNRELSLESGQKAKPIYTSFSTKKQRKPETRTVTVKITLADTYQSKTITRQIEVQPFFIEY